tara:strand:+ start:222 stop:443 length:222 start_codon:yes stop_codon:yes gene_type:complete
MPNNYLWFFIFAIPFWGLNFFTHRYLMNNWDYYRHLQKNPSLLELGIYMFISNAWMFLYLLVFVFLFGDEWLY